MTSLNKSIDLTPEIVLFDPKNGVFGTKWGVNEAKNKFFQKIFL